MRDRPTARGDRLGASNSHCLSAPGVPHIEQHERPAGDMELTEVPCLARLIRHDAHLSFVWFRVLVEHTVRWAAVMIFSDPLRRSGPGRLARFRRRDSPRRGCARTIGYNGITSDETL